MSIFIKIIVKAEEARRISDSELVKIAERNRFSNDDYVKKHGITYIFTLKFINLFLQHNVRL